jgi:hypothetical protein
MPPSTRPISPMAAPRTDVRAQLVTIVVAAALLVLAAVLPGARRDFIHDVVTWDAPAADPVQLPAAGARAEGIGLAPAPRVRVVLIDGLGAATAHDLRTWSGLCTRGVRMTVDVGFPTVSLPVELSLWTGLTQQQTGILFRSDRPLVPALDRRGIPPRVPDSIAIAENHGYIVRSLGFATTLPEAGATPSRDRDPAGWATQWQARAREAVASTARLVFVHVLRVDTAGHRRGAASLEYAVAAGEADAILAQLYAVAPEARWFLLADHGHLETGGHGGEDVSVRQVQGCMLGPGIAPATGGPVHIVDVSRARADSLGLALDKHSPGRPLSVALSHPLAGDASVPPLPIAIGALAIVIMLAGVAASVWSVRRWWITPAWFVVAWILLLAVRGAPTMSMPMVYARESLGDLFDLDRRLMMRCWLPALPIAAVATWFAMPRVGVVRTAAAQLAVPVAALAATLTICHAWMPLLGAERAPIAPHFTALASPMFLIVAQGSAAVALAVLARTALAVIGRRRAAGTRQSAP